MVDVEKLVMQWELYTCKKKLYSTEQMDLSLKTKEKWFLYISF